MKLEEDKPRAADYQEGEADRQGVVARAPASRTFAPQARLLAMRRTVLGGDLPRVKIHGVAAAPPVPELDIRRDEEDHQAQQADAEETHPAVERDRDEACGDRCRD